MDKLRDMQNICFAPEDLLERNRFSREFLNHDLDILWLSKMRSIEVRQARVKAVLLSFHEAKEVAGTISSGNYTGAFITIRQAVPCVLHMENRTREKYIKMVLLEGFDVLTSDAEQKQYPGRRIPSKHDYSWFTYAQGQLAASYSEGQGQSSGTSVSSFTSSPSSLRSAFQTIYQNSNNGIR
jgi:hypothetical protein